MFQNGLLDHLVLLIKFFTPLFFTMVMRDRFFVWQKIVIFSVNKKYSLKNYYSGLLLMYYVLTYKKPKFESQLLKKILKYLNFRHQLLLPSD